MGLAGRSALDKVLALRGGADLVAQWAQLSSLIELVAGVALNGVGAGLSVLVARAKAAERAALLRQALRLGLGAALPVALVAAALAWLQAGELPRSALMLACAAGWVAIVPGLVNSFWLGRQQRPRMLALASASALLVVLTGAFAPRPLVLEAVAVAAAAPALLILLVRRPLERRTSAQLHALRRYVVPGLAIGVLSPVSMLAARALVADALSWHQAGVLQALWRIADWVCAFAGGLLSVYFLPRFAAARDRRELAAELRTAVLAIVVPAAVLLGGLFFVHRELLAALYQPDFAASAASVALVFAGSLARIASWVPLFALYALRRTGAIAAGELLSLPLYALMLLLAQERLGLELAGGLWLFAFVAYTAFNTWAVRRS